MSDERKFATIQTITSIEPIEKYDRVELATVSGWSCIVKKGDFSVGDKCVYFEPDSLLYPHKIWDSFLEKRKYRIRTLKMCGTISQGLILPISIIPILNPDMKYFKVDDFDLTAGLNVKHYETEKEPVVIKKKRGKIMTFLMRNRMFRWVVLQLIGSKKKGNFPSHIMSKTDEKNIQSIPSIIRRNEGEFFYFSEKLEGQCSNYFLTQKKGLINKFLNKKDFYVSSHNVNLPHKMNNNWWNMAIEYDIEKKLYNYWKETGIHIGIQGEIIGPGIQGNIYKLDNLAFYVFNVKNLDTGGYLKLHEKNEFCLKLGLLLVPIFRVHILFDSDTTVKKLLDMSNGKSMINENTDREGFVVRRMDNDKISFKVKSPKYLADNE